MKLRRWNVLVTFTILVSLLYGTYLYRGVTKTDQSHLEQTNLDQSKPTKSARDAYLAQIVLKPHISEPKECTNSTKRNNYIMLDFKGGRTGNALNQLHCLLALSHKFCYTALIGPMNVVPYGQHVRPIFDVKNIEFKRSIDNSTFHWLPNIHSFSTRYQLSKHISNWTLQYRCNGFAALEGQEEYIRSSIRVKEQFVQEANACMQRLPSGKPLVAIHVRRGDKVNHPAYTGYKYNDLEWYVPYINKVMAYLKRKYTDLSFVFISDDLDWCRSHFKGADVHFSPCTTIGCDIVLIGRSDHVVLTLGTFGVNAAWLGDVKSVIYSRKYVYEDHVLNDVYLPSWINIDDFDE